MKLQQCVEEDEDQAVKKNFGQTSFPVWLRNMQNERRSTKKIDVFQNQCLKSMMKIKWQDKISNRKLLERANVERLSEEVRRRRLRFIGHILRQQPDNDCVTALTWTPEGKGKRGRPKTTWRRSTVEKERSKAGWQSWREVRTAAQDMNRWKAHVEALCAILARGDRGR